MGADDSDLDRRRFLELATCGVGATVGLGLVVPATCMVTSTTGKQIVTSPRDPIDVGEAGILGPQWRKVDVIAPEVRDAWVTAKNVLLGAAYVRGTSDKVEALSAVCPHLGCPVGWEPDNKSFLCPCHNSRFGAEGEIVGKGPALRGLDPLPVEVKDGRLRLTWIAYKLDTKSREPA